MPELPDVTVYIESLERLLAGARLEKVELFSPFLLRTAVPPLASAEGERVVRFSRTVLSLTEAGSKRRASPHVVAGEAALKALDPGGIEVPDSTMEAFRERLTAENHTLKRALTDPRLFSGIGNAYSDEILHRARLSPVALTGSLSEAEIGRLHEAAKAVLREWTERLRGEGFPEEVTAFREGMAVHGRYGEPCPVCGAPVQRVCTPRTRPTTARAARPAAASSPTAPSRGCSRRAGRARSMS